MIDRHLNQVERNMDATQQVIDSYVGDVRQWADRRAKAEQRLINALLVAVGFAALVGFGLGFAIGGVQ